MKMVIKSIQKIIEEVVIQMMLNLLMQGILLSQLFHLLKWLSSWKLKKDSKVQNEITQTFEKYNKKSYSKLSRIGQNALIQK